jgi:hypothetical protein
MCLLNPCLVHPVALAINKKNETPLFATVFVVLSILLHVSTYIGHLQVLRIQNANRTAVCKTNSSSFDILYTQYLKMAYVGRNI